MATASLSAIGYFVPIFAFLLVFIVIYALLVKTQILGGSSAVMLFVSFILSAFFIIEANLIEFVQFSSAWMSVLVFVLFFVLVILAFIPGIKIGEFLGKGNWFAWVLLVVILVVFVVSSAYVFNWALNWGMVKDWFGSDWFGMILLLIIAGVISWRITVK
ncbi:MAG: hypothetical protein V1889_00665 [archaeon]